MAILAIQPWPGTEKILIQWSQPNWGGNPSDKITINYRLSDFLMAGMFLRIVFVINLYKHIAEWRTLLGFRMLTDKNMHSHFILHLRDGLT